MSLGGLHNKTTSLVFVSLMHAANPWCLLIAFTNDSKIDNGQI